MNKLMKRYAICMLAALMLLLPMNVWAAPSFGISASASSVKPGATFTVAVGGSCCGRVNISVQNGSASKSSVWVEEGYENITITAGDSGSVVVTATPADGMSDLDGNLYNPGARSVTVSIKQPTPSTPDTPSTPSTPSTPDTPSTPSTPSTPDTPSTPTKDSNSKLSGLKVSPGSLAPAFNANTMSYTVTVPEDTTSVTISATAQSSKAKVSVSGGKDLKLGPNEAKVVVTAEDGSTTVYKLTIMCGELEKIEMDGQVYVINESFTDDKIPVGFVRTTVTYKGRQYQVVAHEKNGLKLMNLKNDEVGSAFFIFKPETQKFHYFVQVPIAEGKNMVPLPLDSTAQFADNEVVTLTLKGKSFEAWKVDEDYSLIKLMNSDGEEIVYQYDKVDGTLQRYAGPVAEEPVEQEPAEKQEDPQKEKNFLEEYALYIIIGLGALTVILAIAMIYFIATRKYRHEARKRKLQKQLEKDMAKAEKLEAKKQE